MRNPLKKSSVRRQCCVCTCWTEPSKHAEGCTSPHGTHEWHCYWRCAARLWRMHQNWELRWLTVQPVVVLRAASSPWHWPTNQRRLLTQSRDATHQHNQCSLHSTALITVVHSCSLKLLQKINNVVDNKLQT